MITTLNGAIEACALIQIGFERLMSSIEMGLVEQTLAANHLVTASEGCST